MMGFVKFLFRRKQDGIYIGSLFGFFFAYLFLINLPIARLLENGSDIISGPFTSVPFKFNIFNFDPILYLGDIGSTVTHPFFRMISLPVYKLSALVGYENYVTLYFQSGLVSFTIILIFIYCVNIGVSRILALLVTIIFGNSTNSIMVTLIPDSYAYAQFIIVLSVVYLLYVNQNMSVNVYQLTILGILNFGITLTNAIPFVGSVLVSKLSNNIKNYLKNISLTLFFGIVTLFILCVIDIFLMPGESWVIDIGKGLESGGYVYVSDFHFQEHFHVLISLFVAPLLFPRLQILDPAGLVAIVTNINNPYLIIVESGAFVLIGLSVVGLLMNYRNRNVWILMIYILFSTWLHLIKGFGLATHEYDLFLYASHYLFALILGLGWLGKVLQRNRILELIIICLLISAIIVQTIFNYNGMLELRQTILQGYF